MKILGDFRRYAIVSGLSFALNIAITFGLHEFAGLGEEWSYALSLVVIFVVNFLMMRHYVYASEREGTNAGRQMAMTAASSVMFRLIEYGSFLLLHTVLGMYYLLAIVVIMGVSFIIKFFFYRQVVFVRRAKS